ncbi:MAG: hypothetical protein GWO86_03155 [Planctomycetes bacterium]|nr:hypothetical protein [Planctomycetota bacterium]
MAAYTFTFKIDLAPWLDKALFRPILLYRRLRYGCAFRRIRLTRGKSTIVDQDDFEKLKQYKWHVHPVQDNGQNQYAIRTVQRGNKRCRCAMHRVISQAPEGLFVDHINHNGLDNRRTNLRIVTAQQNSWNTRRGRGLGKSKYKGVTWDKDSQKWRASICIEKKPKYLGCFEDEKEAAMAYDRAAKKHRGEYAFLNFKIACAASKD